ncbi:PIN domain-like protein [Bombardia bombarda]|uniref:PIN domain-like protein n=1 Tax=Bombardia bombarda TaxID=252184 RepID=A0AA39U7X3_9PEZI|nr:PIN domain-like protein [Bombardia bombarda]
MGITAFWGANNTFLKGEKTSLAEWSAEHFEKYKRPLRIAVDAPCWQYNNPTQDGVAATQEEHEDSQLAKKAMMYRIFREQSWNIQHVFVFDGPIKNGAKRGQTATMAKSEDTALFKELLRHLGIPCHQARAEAGAECARMQRLGLVDAMWSDDCDVFMFGCTKLVRFHRVYHGKGQVESNDYVDVYTDQHVLEFFKWQEPLLEKLVLFANLSGCDYTEQGLKGIRYRKSSVGIVKWSGTLAKAMCETFTDNGKPERMDKWREHFQKMLTGQCRNITIPEDWPSIEAVDLCYRPKVSSDEVLCNIPRVCSISDVLPDTYRFLRENFNRKLRATWPIEFLTALELNRKLVGEKNTRGQWKDIKVEKKTKEDPYNSEKSSLSVRARPQSVISGLAEVQIEGYDPNEEVECIRLLDCVLRYGLPPDMIPSQAEQPQDPTEEQAAGAPARQSSGPTRASAPVRAKRPPPSPEQPSKTPKRTKVLVFSQSSEEDSLSQPEPPGLIDLTGDDE